MNEREVLAFDRYGTLVDPATVAGELGTAAVSYPGGKREIHR